MEFKEFINSVLFYFSVPKCVACGERLLKSEKALCRACKKEYDEVLLFNCSLCGKPYRECSCSTQFLKSHNIKNTVKVYRYLPTEETASNMLIYNLKRENRFDVLSFLKDELSSALKNKGTDFSNYIITNVPRRKKSHKKYGYDHSSKLAKALAKDMSLEYKAILISRAKHDQKFAHGREERLANTDFHYRRKAFDLKGKNVILVDDIITSGASMSACATLLKGLGAKNIIAAALAIAYKDDYTPFERKNEV